jgi:hypothetical protein
MPNYSHATSLLDRIDTERVGRLVHDAVSDSPIPDLVSAASNAAESLTDQVAEVAARRRTNRARRVAVAVAVVGLAVAIGMVVSRRRRSGDDTTSDIRAEDQLRPGAANPN